LRSRINIFTFTGLIDTNLHLKSSGWDSSIDRKDESAHLSEVMNWIENLANSDIFAVSNLVAGSIGEPLIASHEDKLPDDISIHGEENQGALQNAIFQIFCYRCNKENISIGSLNFVDE
jgi:hypothetical protein